MQLRSSDETTKAFYQKLFFRAYFKVNKVVPRLLLLLIRNKLPEDSSAPSKHILGNK